MEPRTNQQGKDWEVRAGVTYPDGAMTGYKEGRIYVHEGTLVAARRKAEGILRAVHPQIMSVVFLNTHPIAENDIRPETAGFPGLELRLA